MSRRVQRLADLAREADLDLDEALVTLWDAGLDCLENPNSLIAARDIGKARSALGLVGAREQVTVDYWLRVSGLDRPALAAEMAKLGVHLDANTRRIPKNSLRRFRQRFAVQEALLGRHDEAPVPQPHTVEPLVWEQVGKQPIRWYLSEEDLITIHEILEADARDSGDPIEPPGVKDPNLVSMSAHRPHTAIGSEMKYPTAEMAAAALFHSVALNHGFHNGNKRTALVALVAFLDANGLMFTCAPDDLFRTTLRVAQHGLVPAGSTDLSDRETMHLAEWIRTNTRPVERSNHPLKWHKLKQILGRFDCRFDHEGGVGNRINIRRQVRRKGLIRGRTEELTVQVKYAGDGTEAEKNTIAKIRRELELDAGYGVDSNAFYHDAEVDLLISEYKPILKRLSRL